MHKLQHRSRQNLIVSNSSIMKDCVLFSSHLCGYSTKDLIKPYSHFNNPILTITFPRERLRDLPHRI